jgi:hypothetical protein
MHRTRRLKDVASSPYCWIGYGIADLYSGIVGLECVDTDWRPALSAPLHSQLTGVLASLVFAGMVLVLGFKPAEGGSRANALMLLGSSFFTLMMASFDFGVISGDMVCARAWTLTMPAAGLFGLGFLGVFCGVSWLMAQPGGVNRPAVILIVVTARVVAVIVGFNLWTTADLYLRKLEPLTHFPGWLDRVVDASWLVVLGLVIAQFVYAAASKSGRRADGWWSRRRVAFAAYGCLVCTVGATIVFGQVVIYPPEYWAAPGEDLLILATLTSFGLPASVLLLFLASLPTGGSRVSALNHERIPGPRASEYPAQ